MFLFSQGSLHFIVGNDAGFYKHFTNPLFRFQRLLQVGRTDISPFEQDLAQLFVGRLVALRAANPDLVAIDPDAMELVGDRLAAKAAVAISSAIRNPGLALLVATLNAAPPEITATVLAYLIVSAVAVIPYVAWRRRRPDPVERE